MIGAALLVVLASAERQNFDAFVSSPGLFAPREALSPDARALFDAAYVSGFEPRRGVPTVLWAPPVPVGQRPLRTLGLTAEQAARRHLFAWAPVYRFAPAALADATLAGVHDLGDGAVVVGFRRVVNGLPVFMSELNVVMTGGLDLVAITGHLPPQPGAGTFALTAESALSLAARDLTGEPMDVKPALPRPGKWVDYDAAHARVRQGFYALPLRLVPAYQVELTDGDDAFGYVVSAEDGAILTRVGHVAAHSYRVWADAVAPFTPWDGPWQDSTPHPDGAATAYQPMNLPAPLVTLQNAGVSTNDPWLPAGATTLEGNNAEAYGDLLPPDGLNDPDAGKPILADGGVPDGGVDDAGVPFLFTADPRVPISAADTFDFLADFSSEPTTPANRNAGGVNAFYAVNWLHDLFYDLGFDEAAGNAQKDNLGRGGLAGDPVQIELGDYSGRNNANMATPADGRSPRMQLFLWSSTGPQRLTVNTPVNDAGPIGAAIAYPGSAPSWNVTGDLIEPVDPDGGWSGCLPATNAAALDGKIALMNGVTCGDAVRFAHARDAGTLGVVVVRAGIGSTTPAAQPLPAHQVTAAVASPWRVVLADGGTVNVTLDYAHQPDRDGAVDTTTVSHEWTHYLTNRLVGNADGLIPSQARGMGEGWSDFVALLTTLRPSDATAPSNVNWNGTWGLSPWDGGGYDLLGNPTAAFYFGLNRYPYTADKAKNPLSFRHIGKGVQTPLSPRPRFVAPDASEVHATGEVWTEMLWECAVRLLRSGRYTVPQAQKKMLGYLVAALKATPLQPTFTEARDALLAVTRAASPADDFPLFVEAFASRGLGLGAVAPPREAIGNTPLQEDTDTSGARWRLVSLTVSDGPTGACDSDGFLDSGEAGAVTVKLQNIGARPLAASMLTLTASEPRLQFAPGAVGVPPTAPFATATVTVPVTLRAGLTPVPSADLTVTVTDPQAAVPLSAQKTVRLDADRVASATEGFEDQEEDFYATTGSWSIGSSTADPASVHLFRPLALSPLTHAVVGHDMPQLGDNTLTTPPLQVGQGPFGFTFVHSYAFDTSAGTNFWDGAILEISTNRWDWTQIPGSAISPTYDNTIKVSPNPLSGLPGFVGIRLVPVTATVSLGTQYAGQTVWIRFRIGTDGSIGGTGWTIDDVAFTGLTNTPFRAIVPHRQQCSGNLPPTILAPLDFAADERTTVTLVPRLAVDPNGDPVTVAWSVASGLTATIAGDQLTLPDVPADATTTLRATATDGKGGSATADVVVTIRNVNRAPSVTASAPATAIFGTGVALTATGTDPDGEALSYLWAQSEGPAVTLTNGTQDVATFTAPEFAADTTLGFTVIASDGAAASPPASVAVVVKKRLPAELPPKPMPRGCGCGTTSAGPALLALAFVLLRRRRAWLLSLLLAACGSGGPVPDAGGSGGGGGGGGGMGGGTGGGMAGFDAGFDAGAPDAGPFDAGPFDAGHRTVLAARSFFFTTAPDAGIPDSPVAAAVKVTCPLPDGGSEDRLSETVQPGLMQVRDVRDGTCVVLSSGGGVVTASGTVDFSGRFVGRSGAPVLPAGTLTNLALTATGYSPWVPAADDLGIASLETGYALVANVKGGASRPPAGVTSGTLTTAYAISGANTPGASPAQGDRFFVTQLRTFTTPTTHRAPVALSLEPAPAISAAGTVAHSVTLQPVTLVDLDLDQDFGDYALQAVEGHPDSVVSASSLSVQAQPAYAQLGWVKVSPTGTAFTLSLFLGNGPQLQGLYKMAPAPAGTTALVVASQSYVTQFQVPGAGSTSLTSSHQRAVPLSGFAKALPPQLSPPQGLAVNGVPATGQLAPTGTRPRITWDPPRLGAPDSYQVTLFNAVVTAGVARFVGTAPVRTFARSYTPPAGLLTAGQPYLVVVRALKGAAWTRGDEVFPNGPSEEFAEVLSGILLP